VTPARVELARPALEDVFISLVAENASLADVREGAEV
jgi:hypothetical protein